MFTSFVVVVVVVVEPAAVGVAIVLCQRSPCLLALKKRGGLCSLQSHAGEEGGEEL